MKNHCKHCKVEIGLKSKYCIQCFNGIYRPPSKKQKRILKHLEKEPILQIGKDYDKSLKSKLRTLKHHKNIDISWFRYNGIGKGKFRNKNLKEIPHFFIIFNETQRIQAWKMLLKQIPAIDKINSKYVNFGKPILGDLLYTGALGKKDYKERIIRIKKIKTPFIKASEKDIFGKNLSIPIRIKVFELLKDYKEKNNFLTYNRAISDLITSK